MLGTLYVIATPIGNREDITLRAIRMLGSVDVLLCEDTRHTGQLLQYIANEMTNDKYLRRKVGPTLQSDSVSKHRRVRPLKGVGQISNQIQNSNFKKPKLISYQEHNEIERIPEVITLLLDGTNVGLVSDAGTPLISDPGFKLVRECIKQGINVVSIPGPTAFVSALVCSGLPTDKFLFLGYLPKHQGKRKKLLHKITTIIHIIVVPIVIYESPFRLKQTLSDIKETMGDVEIVIARELTKMHEEIWRGNVSEAIRYFQNPKGEFVVFIYNIYNVYKARPCEAN